MADVRSLLKNERASRRIQHKHASYSTTGSLLCTACHLQLKSESLWEGHLRSAGHIQKALLQSNSAASAASANKKRKASEGEDTIRKRTKAAANGLPEGFFDEGAAADAPRAPEPRRDSTSTPPLPGAEIQMVSRPATPSKPVEEVPQRAAGVDEDEWAAFEADITQTEQAMAVAEAVITAPAMTAAEVAAKSREEENKRQRERQEAELEGDKEDAARKLEEEFEEMETLEARVRRMREKREMLRKEAAKGLGLGLATPDVSVVEEKVDGEDEDEEDDDEDDDDWDGFRLKA